jgi:hypothetical protein
MDTHVTAIKKARNNPRGGIGSNRNGMAAESYACNDIRARKGGTGSEFAAPHYLRLLSYDSPSTAM